MSTYQIHPITPDDEGIVAALLTAEWGARLSVSRGKMLDAAKLPGFIVRDGDAIVGLVTLHFENGECEVVTLNAFVSGRGVGRALLSQAADAARERAMRRVWLITTNDNTDAMAFYQKCGWRMVAIHLDSITHARLLKPQIPLIGHHGIPICDEIELELVL